VWLGWEPIAVIEGGVTSLVRTDHIGRPVFATNTTGVKVWTASYTPFGGVRTVTGTPINARFPGQWFQAESGLHQNWMRDYGPTTGRYLEADPLGLVDGASVYGYVTGNPVTGADPMGLQEVPMDLGLTDGWWNGIENTAPGEFVSGFSSYWRGLYRCASGYCSSINEQRLKQYADFLNSNPDVLRCLGAVLWNYGQNHPSKLLGRTAGGQLTGAMTLLGTRGASPATRGGLSAEVGASAQLAAMIGDLGYYLDDEGNRDAVEAAFMFLYGNKDRDAGDAPCECQEILQSYR
jgi:RHS repeat-associated protein